MSGLEVLALAFLTPLAVYGLGTLLTKHWIER